MFFAGKGIAQITLSAPTTVCAGVPFNITITSPNQIFFTLERKIGNGNWSYFIDAATNSNGVSYSYSLPSYIFNTTSYRIIIRTDNTFTTISSTPSPSSIDVTLFQTPIIQSFTSNTFCSEYPFSFNPSLTGNTIPDGTTYSWLTPSTAGGTLTGGSTGSNSNTISGTLVNLTNVIQTATYTVTPTSAQGCPGSSFTVSVPINPTPKILSQETTICSAGTFSVTLTDNSPSQIVPVGTTYTWTAPVVTGVAGAVTGGTSGSGSIITGTLTNTTNSIQTAIYTVTPTSVDGCVGGTFTVTVTIKPRPKIANNPNIPQICNGTSFVFTPLITDIVPTYGNGTMYTWTVIDNPSINGESNVSTPTSNFTQTLSNTSNSAIDVLYTVTPISNGCSGPDFSATVTLVPSPLINSPLTTELCSGSSLNFTPSNVTHGIVPANTTYTWTIGANNYVTGQTEELSTPRSSITSNSLINSQNSNQNLNYTVTTSSLNGCATTTFQIIVTVVPQARINNKINAPICSGLGFSITPGSSYGDIVVDGTNYTWTVQSNPNISGLSGVLTPTTSIGQVLTNLSNTEQTAIYNVSSVANTCASATFSISVKVAPRPKIANNTATATCSAAPFSFTANENDIIPTGTTYTWSFPTVTGNMTGGTSASSVGTISGTLTNPTNTAQTALYTITPLSGNCTGGTFTMSVTVNPKATIANNTATPICSVSSFTFSSTVGDIIPVGTIYNWDFPTVTGGITGGVNSTGSGTISGTLTNPTNTVQTALYTITPITGNCTGGTFTMSVTVNPKATITNNIATPICSATSFSFSSVSTDIIPTGTTYTWSSPSVTGSMTGGTSATSVGTISGTLTNPTNTAQTALYSITPLSGNCTGGTFTMSVTVNPKATIANNVATPICSATAFGFISGNGDIIPTGTTYSWSLPSVTGGITGGTITNGAGIISETLTNPTNTAQTALYTITPLSGNCTGGTFTMSVTVNPKATIANNIATPICSATSFSFSSVSTDIIPTGTTYTWSSPTVTGGMTGGTSATSVGTISGTLTNPTNTAQTALYTITPLSGNCTGVLFTLSVTVNPRAAIQDKVGDAICSNNPFSFTPVNGIDGVVPDGTTYKWTVTDVLGGITGDVAQLTYINTLNQILTNGTNIQQTALYRVETITGSCQGGIFTVTAKVNPLPNAPITTPVVVFYNGQFQRFNVVVNSGESIRWYFPTNTLLANEPTYKDANASPYNVFASALINSTGCESLNKTQASLTINKKVINASATVSDKVYDQNTNAIAVISSNEVVNGDELSFAYANANFNDKTANVGKLVTVTGVNLSGGNSINNYTLNVQSATLTATGTITPKPMVVSGVVLDKIYDRTTSATVTLTSPDLISNDNVTLSYLTALFDNFLASSNKSVTVTGISKSGIDAGNYTLTNTTLSLTGTINKKELTIANASSADKVYNGNRVAVISGGTLQGVINPDVVTLQQTGLFDTKNVGSSKIVTSTSTINGVDASNYFLTQPVIPNASITVKTITITGAVASNKVYDATTVATVTNGQLQGVESIDASTVVLKQAGIFASKDVGVNIGVTSDCSISGTDATNYSLTQPTLASKNITKKELTMSGLTVPATKIYDATTKVIVGGAATLKSAIAPGTGTDDDGTPYTGDLVNISGTVIGAYNSKDVNTANKVTFSGLSLSGLQSINYNLKIQEPSISAITKKKLTMFGLSVADTKVYDGNRNAKVLGTSFLQTAQAPGTGTTEDGKPYIGDIVNVDGAPTALYNSKNVVEANKVSFAGLSVSGAQSDNYDLVIQDDYPAKITPLNINVTADKQTKVYGDSDPLYTYTNDPLISGDSFTGLLSRVEGQNVGAYAILLGTLDLGTNYTITYTSSNLVITEASMYIKPDTTYRTYGDQPNTDGLTTSKFIATGLKYNETVKYVKLYFPVGLGSGNDPRDSVGVYSFGVRAKDPFGGTALASNYKIVSFPGDIRIKPLPITITADSKTKRQSEADPIFTYKLSINPINGDTVSGNLIREPGELPGTYPIRQGTLAINKNYEITYYYDMLTVLTVENIFVVPNAFTPNSDGLNDLLKILHNSSVVGVNYFQIFNKAGKLVFETKNIEQGWDGRLNGLMQESDVYYWFAEFKTWNNLSIQRKGTVVLLK